MSRLIKLDSRSMSIRKVLTRLCIVALIASQATVLVGVTSASAATDTWTASTLPASANWYSVAYGGGSFVAIDNSGTSDAAYSTDGGVTWTASTLPASTTWNSVTYGGGVFVAVSTGIDAAYSTDGGVTWTASTFGTYGATWSSVTYGAGVFVAVSSGSADAAYSTNGGVTWTASTLPASAAWQGVAYGGGLS